MIKSIKYICIIQIIFSFIFSQNIIQPNSLLFPKNKLTNELRFFNNDQSSIRTNNFLLSFHVNIALNSGHSNIDNNAEFFSAGKFNYMRSFRLEYSNNWLFIELEPYSLLRNNIFNGFKVNNSFQFVNNNTNGNGKLISNPSGLKQSQIIIHYKGLGIGYGNINHWWGNGFHSSISLTSNSPSQETFSLGTFNNIKIGNLLFYSKIIIRPFKNYDNDQIYFSGLRFNLSYVSNPIISIGFNRFYMSGNFDNLNQLSSLTDPWGFNDALSLVFEPIFGENKRKLDYTIPNTPGFDIWDETLSGNIKLVFPNDNLEFYLELVSDDNRANLTDLTSHWDHTLGYTIGIKKFSKLNSNPIFFGIEYLSTKPSNTFKPDFYRGDGYEINYFTRVMYNHFTYNTRFMGPHSGSSSDDLIFLLGYGHKNSIIFLSYNIERHGLKSWSFPEYKKEISILFDYELDTQNKIFLNIEREKIINYGFEAHNISISNMVWLGYSHYFYKN